MISREQAHRLREMIERLAKALDDAEALEVPEMYPLWVEGVEYAIGDRVRYESVLYKCVQAHTSAYEWNPSIAVSLWARVINEGIPEWVQPDSTNPYMMGDMVTHNGQTWISDIDYNVFEPGVAGWSVVE